MVGKYKVITLCGSTRFKDTFMEEQKRLTLEGNIVISVGLFGHSGDDEVWTEGTKEMLDDMHKRKIDMSLYQDCMSVFALYVAFAGREDFPAFYVNYILTNFYASDRMSHRNSSIGGCAWNRYTLTRPRC